MKAIRNVVLAMIAGLMFTACSGSDGSNGEDGTNVDLNQTIEVIYGGLTTDDYYDVNMTVVSIDSTRLTSDGGVVEFYAYLKAEGDANNFIIGWTDDYYSGVLNATEPVTDPYRLGNFIVVNKLISVPRNDTGRGRTLWFQIMYLGDTEITVFGEDSVYQDKWIDPDELQRQIDELQREIFCDENPNSEECS